jgi:predicted short-subunit dehydrogenase-like oxidoreductase (DUF2520 family)
MIPEVDALVEAIQNGTWNPALEDVAFCALRAASGRGDLGVVEDGLQRIREARAAQRERMETTHAPEK